MSGRLSGRWSGTWLLVVLAAICGLGCSGSHVQYVQTEMHEDGSIDRLVLQSLANAPDGAFDRDRWDEVTYPRPKNFDDFEGDLAKRPDGDAEPVSDRSKEESFVWARKRVTAGGDVPKTLELKTEGIERTSTFDVQRTVRELGFLTEYEWHETLTDTIDLADAARARREAVQLFGDLFERACANYFEPDCDASELVAFVRSESSEILEMAYGLLLQLSPKLAQVSLEPVIKEQGEKLAGMVLKKHRIPAPNFDNEDQVRLVQRKLLTQILGRTVKRRDGKAFDPAPLVAGLLGLDGSSSESDSVTTKLEAAWDAAIAKHPGGKKELNDKCGQLAVRILGIHLTQIGQDDRFRCVVKLPGTIVATTGTLLSDRETSWRFSGRAAFPLGFHMHARSIVISQKVVPGVNRAWTKDRQKWLSLVELAAKDEALAEALRASHTAASLAPLDDYLSTIEQPETQNRAIQARGILVGPQK